MEHDNGMDHWMDADLRRAEAADKSNPRKINKEENGIALLSKADNTLATERNDAGLCSPCPPVLAPMLSPSLFLLLWIVWQPRCLLATAVLMYMSHIH